MGWTAAAATALIAAVHEQQAIRDWAVREFGRLEGALQKECPDGPSNNDWCKKLKQALRSAEGGIKSLRRQIRVREDKLANYLANPDKFDNLGILKNAPDAITRQNIIDGRANHLHSEIRAFEQSIAKFEAFISEIRKAMQKYGC